MSSEQKPSENPEAKRYVRISETQALLLDHSAFDLAAAALDVNLRATGFSPEERIFWASFDYFQSERIADLVIKITHAHGFKAHLENFLAALDACRVGLLTSLDEAQSAKVRRYLPVIHFTLPTSLAQGPLLDSFYDEINQALSWRSGSGNAGDPPKAGRGKGGKLRDDEPDEIESMRQQIDYLALKNLDLSRQVQGLTSRAGLAQGLNLEKSVQEIRVGQIVALDLLQRRVTVRSDRKSSTFSFDELEYLPQNGDACIYLTQGERRPHRILFPKDPERLELRSIQGTVAGRSADTIKLKFADGSLWQVPLTSFASEQHAEAFFRGSPLIGTFSGRELLHLKRLERPSEARHAKLAQEELRFHLRQLAEQDDENGVEGSWSVDAHALADQGETQLNQGKRKKRKAQ